MFGIGTLNKILVKATCFILSSTNFILSSTKNLRNLNQNKNNEDITDKTTLLENTKSIITDIRKYNFQII